MTSLHSSATSTVTPQSSEGRLDQEPTVPLDRSVGRDSNDHAEPEPTRRAESGVARRGSPDPLHATDRYRLTVPFVDRIR